MNQINVGGRAVGAGQRTLVIAEIGVNHDGSLAKAMELIRIAADCGADAVKLQIFRADSLMHRRATFAGYQRERVGASDPAAMLRQYELADLDVVAAMELARSLGVMPLATPFSLRDVEVIEALNLPAVKIASPDIVNLPLLRRAIASRRPLLISTGASTMGEVGRCTNWTAAASVALLHCVSSYPVDARDAYLSWIGQLQKQFTVPVGYSDHTTDERAGAMAVLAGACIVEKHLTYDRAAAGPDHSASADPDQFRRYVEDIREAERWLGGGRKRVLAAEADVRTVSRQSLVLDQSIRAGERITASMLIVQRPGEGISAAMIDDIVGLVAARDLSAGTMLQPDMLAAEQNAQAA